MRGRAGKVQVDRHRHGRGGRKRGGDGVGAAGFGKRSTAAVDRFTVGSPLSVGSIDEVLPMAAPVAVPILTAMFWLLGLPVSMPVSVMLPLVWPAAMVIEVADAE